MKTLVSEDIEVDDLSVQLALAFSGDSGETPVKEEPQDETAEPTDGGAGVEEPKSPKSGPRVIGKFRRPLTRRDPLLRTMQALFCLA